MDFLVGGLGLGALLVVLGFAVRDLGPWLRRPDPDREDAALARESWLTICHGVSALMMSGGGVILAVTAVVTVTGVSDRIGTVVVLIVSLVVLAAVTVGSLVFIRGEAVPIQPGGIARPVRTRPAGQAVAAQTGALARSTAHDRRVTSGDVPDEDSFPRDVELPVAPPLPEPPIVVPTGEVGAAPLAQGPEFAGLPHWEALAPEPIAAERENEPAEVASVAEPGATIVEITPDEALSDGALTDEDEVESIPAAPSLTTGGAQIDELSGAPEPEALEDVVVSIASRPADEVPATEVAVAAALGAASPPEPEPVQIDFEPGPQSPERELTGEDDHIEAAGEERSPSTGEREDRIEAWPKRSNPVRRADPPLGGAFASPVFAGIGYSVQEPANLAEPAEPSWEESQSPAAPPPRRQMTDLPAWGAPAVPDEDVEPGSAAESSSKRSRFRRR